MSYAWILASQSLREQAPRVWYLFSAIAAAGACLFLLSTNLTPGSRAVLGWLAKTRHQGQYNSGDQSDTFRCILWNCLAR
jgi:hypothetical protein